ncbi:MAG: hypothetical protein IPJ34_43195 [Myxococcales bacterium]|nr:hypothetical protein [Myxococcales bacterium]
MFCFDDGRKGRAFLRRTYPRGLALDVGFHWDGARNGHVVTFGSSDRFSEVCEADFPGRRVVIGVDARGRLFASGPETSVLRMAARLTTGTHLATFVVTTTGHALFLDGELVDQGEGTHGVTVEFPERWSPGFVLGNHNQRWWNCGAGAPSRWLRMAPFFVHLRDEVEAVTAFDAYRSLQPNAATVLLFDERGVDGSAWKPTAGVGGDTSPAATTPDLAGRAYGPSWVPDVWASCLRP